MKVVSKSNKITFFLHELVVHAVYLLDVFVKNNKKASKMILFLHTLSAGQIMFVNLENSASGAASRGKVISLEKGTSESCRCGSYS